MRRKIALGLLVLVVGTIAFLGVRIYQRAAAKRVVAEHIATLPAFEVATLSGDSLGRSDLPEGEPVVLVYFRSTCHFCQAETRSLRAHEKLQQAASVLMVSAEGQPTLKQFAAEYGLDETPRIRVVQDQRGKLAEAFGIERVPNTFIYGADRRLLKHFEGEASAEAIYRVLQPKTPTSGMAEAGGQDDVKAHDAEAHDAEAHGECTFEPQADAGCYED